MADKPQELTNDQIRQGFQFIMSEVKKIAESVDEIKAGRQENKPDPKPDPKPEDKGPTDLEDMTRDQLVNHIVGKVTEAIKPLQEGVSEALRGVKTVSTRGEIEKLEAKHSDFWEYSDEMKELQKEYPTASVDDLFALAKARNPEKVETISKKQREAAEAKEKERLEKEGPKFTGFMPTSGRSVSSEKLDAHTAAAKAFDESDLDAALHAGGAPNQ